MKNAFIIIIFSLFLFACKEEIKKTEAKDDIKKQYSESAMLDSLIKKEPENDLLYYERAMYYAKIDFVPKALVDILSAIKLNPSEAKYHLMAGDIYINMGQGEDAIKTIESAIRILPEDEELRIRIVQYHYFLKDYQKALITANDLLKMNKNNANAYFFKGMIHKEIDNIDKAISNFQTCVEQDPLFYNAYMQLGLLFSRQNNDLALKYFDNALKIKETSREALYGKAYHFQQKKQYNKAKEEYKKMIANNSRDFQAFYNIGYCYLEQDSLVKSFKNFDIASNIKPDYVDAIFMKAQLNKQFGNIAEARRLYNISLKMLPDNEIIKQALKDIEEK